MMNLERLEQRIALDADGLDVHGPAIPESLDYIAPPQLMRPGQVQVDLPAILPQPSRTALPSNRNIALNGNLSYDAAFADMASDGTVTLREARDWLVSMDNETGYNRFEVWAAQAEVNDPAHLEVFTPKSFKLLTEVVNSPDFFYNNSDFISVQEKTDLLWNALRVHVDGVTPEPEPLTFDQVIDVNAQGGMTFAEMKSILDIATEDGEFSSEELTSLNNAIDTVDMPEYVHYFTDSVITGHYANNAGDTPEMLVDKWFNGNDTPSTVFDYTEINGDLFVDGVSSTDAKQGSLDDCYVITAMNAIAYTSPEVIENMIMEVEENVWVVRFYDSLQEVHYVTVNNLLPEVSGRSVYAQWNVEMWPALIEKAYAQVTQNANFRFNVTNTYDNLAWGASSTVWENITGQDISSYKGMPEAEHIAMLADGSVLFVSHNNHTYHIESYSEHNGVFFLSNPWGYSHIHATWEQLESMNIVGPYENGYIAANVTNNPISDTRVTNHHSSYINGTLYHPSQFIYKIKGGQLDMDAMRGLT